MDLAQMKAAVKMEGVLSGTAALELIAEVERGKTEIVRMAKEWLQEPEPDNGTVGELDVDEITVMIAGLVDKVESLTALCDGYRGEMEELKANHPERVYMLRAEQAESALTRARAEGMEEAAKIAAEMPTPGYADDSKRDGYEAAKEDIAASIRARATKGDSDEG